MSNGAEVGSTITNSGSRMAVSTFSLITIVVFALPSIHEERTVKSIKDIIPYVEKMAQNYGNDNVCIIYDIDNTLITNSGKYASESWGYWQENKSKNYASQLLDDSNANIHDYLNAIRYFIDYDMVELDTTKIVNALQKKYPSIALTSRDFGSEAATSRQLVINGIDFSKHPIGTGEFDNTYLEVNKYGDDYSMYINGIQYAAGGNKGKLLRTLINKERFKTNNPKLCQGIVYLDDTKSKVDTITQELKDHFNYYALHYTNLPNPELSKNWKVAQWHNESQVVQNLVDRLN